MLTPPPPPLRPPPPAQTTKAAPSSPPPTSPKTQGSLVKPSHKRPVLVLDDLRITHTKKVTKFLKVFKLFLPDSLARASRINGLAARSIPPVPNASAEVVISP